MPVSSGIDFGTSNSTVGLNGPNGARLIAVEGEYRNIPSAIFFDFDEHCTRFGRDAMEHYIEGAHGRLMRSMKSVLGSTLIDDRTRVGRETISFVSILGFFLAHLKAASEKQAETEIEHVVLGRPVFFVDGDPDADRAAQNTLESIARMLGYKHIAFQYEPVAAALDYESHVSREEVALVIDIGGGTADFSVVRVSPEAAAKTSREGDVLASHGVHIGGTDFDREFSLRTVMPHLGLGSQVRGVFDTKMLQDAPVRYFAELATWHLINRQYAPANMNEIKAMLRHAVEPQKIETLLFTLEHKFGSRLANSVELAKIALTDADTTAIPYLTPDGSAEVVARRGELEAAIAALVTRLKGTLDETLRQAGMSASAIDAVFLTGGTSQIPLVQAELLAMMPDAQVIVGDMFGSVGTGLTRDARVKFGF